MTVSNQRHVPRKAEFRNSNVQIVAVLSPTKRNATKKTGEQGYTRTDNGQPLQSALQEELLLSRELLLESMTQSKDIAVKIKFKEVNARKTLIRVRFAQKADKNHKFQSPQRRCAAKSEIRNWKQAYESADKLQSSLQSLVKQRRCR